MGMLYRLEEEADRTITQQMQQTLQQRSTDTWRCAKSATLRCTRHHSYGRAKMTKYGELRMSIPVFCCGDSFTPPHVSHESHEYGSVIVYDKRIYK